MIGLFGTLEMGSRALQAQQQGVEVVGHNLANVNNAAYARQRLRVQTSPAVSTPYGYQGSGVEATAITQVRSQIIDRQIQGEASVMGFLEARQEQLEYLQAGLGESVDRNATATDNAASATPEGQHGLADDLARLFGAFQSLSARPTDLTERQVLLQKAQGLADQFRHAQQRLTDLGAALNRSLGDDLATANKLLTEIARLNQNIADAEGQAGSTANDLRDARQAKLEELAKIVNFATTVSDDGSVGITIAGQAVVTEAGLQDTLASYDSGGGQLLVRTVQGGVPLALTAGSIQATIQSRDEDLSRLQGGLDQLAGTIITEVNAAHRRGFGLNGTTGADFFTGTNARDIQVNRDLVADINRIQASGDPNGRADNTVALALAGLAARPLPTLGGLTFDQRYGQIVANVGEALAGATAQLSDQNLVANMLRSQRESVSGVSLDEEMTDLVKYQRAYQASARLISTVDAMLDEVLNLKR